MHNFLTRDGIAPEELRRLGREELRPYDVRLVDARVERVARVGDAEGFEVEAQGGILARGKRLLLATGIRDRHPDLPNLGELWGKSVFQCPYCDGWEQRGKRLGGYARGPGAVEFALGLRTWSPAVTLFTDGAPLAPEDGDGDGEPPEARLERCGVALRTEPIASLEPAGPRADGRLAAVRLGSGESVPCDALFLHVDQEQKAPFAAELGARFADNGTVDTGTCESTEIPGLYVAGDASRDVQFAIVAAAEGAKAAFAINRELRAETFT